MPKGTYFWGGAGLLALAVPFLFATPYFLSIMVLFFIYVAINLMWGLVLGTAGLQSFATVAIVGIGAYVATFLTVKAGRDDLTNFDYPAYPWYIGVIAATIVGVIVGAIVALPAMRLRGIYFALLTIGLVELVRAYVTDDQERLGGAQGLYGAATFIPADMIGTDGGFQLAYYAALALAIAALIIYRLVAYGRLGLLLRAARESEPFAEALGVHIIRSRFAVFLISSGMLGLIGGFYSAYYRAISPSFFQFSTVLLLFAMIIVGGLNSPRGIIIGTALVLFVDQRFKELGAPRLVLLGFVLLLITLLARDGLAGVPAQIRSWVRGGKDGNEADPGTTAETGETAAPPGPAAASQS